MSKKNPIYDRKWFRKHSLAIIFKQKDKSENQIIFSQGNNREDGSFSLKIDQNELKIDSFKHQTKNIGSLTNKANILLISLNNDLNKNMKTYSLDDGFEGLTEFLDECGL